jgi:hypothetical protein
LPTGFHLSETHTAFIEGGVVIVAATADAERRTSLALALGCRVARNRRRVRIYLDTGKSATLRRDLPAGGQIAVVFSHPASHQTIQIKGRMLRPHPLRPEDHAHMAAYLDRLAHELRRMGEEEALVRTVLACPREAVVAIDFEPHAAFGQTPGPAAGNPIAL